jgi:saccharopine dehydrogenase (NAD+, L-lysine forming)
VNGIYWDARYPRLVTKGWLKEAWAEGRRPKLRVLGDISCDIDGSVECTVRPTEPGNPVYVYNPADGSTRDGHEGPGPVVMAVEILPTELPRESSAYFGEQLMKYIPDMMRLDLRGEFEWKDLPAPIRRSVIVYRGELTPDYSYINKYL